MSFGVQSLLTLAFYLYTQRLETLDSILRFHYGDCHHIARHRFFRCCHALRPEAMFTNC